MKNKYISDFTLDLYSLDGLSPGKRKKLEKAFASDSELLMRYNTRVKAKQELLERYNANNQEDIYLQKKNNSSNLTIKPKKYLRYYIAAAAVILFIFTFIFSFNYIKKNSINNTNDLLITQEDETNKDIFPDQFPTITEESNIVIDNIEDSTILPNTNQTIAANNNQNKNPETTASHSLTNEVIPSSLHNETMYTSSDQQFNNPWQYHNPWQIINNHRHFVIPNGVEYIYDNQFFDNEIENIIIPSSVREIKEKAFDGNPLLSVTIGSNVSISLNAIPGDFVSAYTRCNKAEGIYTRSNISSNDWVKQ